MKIDMTAKSISTRLKRVSQLRKLCLSLMKCKNIDDIGSNQKSLTKNNKKRKNISIEKLK